MRVTAHFFVVLKLTRPSQQTSVFHCLDSYWNISSSSPVKSQKAFSFSATKSCNLISTWISLLAKFTWVGVSAGHWCLMAFHAAAICCLMLSLWGTEWVLHSPWGFPQGAGKGRDGRYQSRNIDSFWQATEVDQTELEEGVKWTWECFTLTSNYVNYDDAQTDSLWASISVGTLLHCQHGSLVFHPLTWTASVRAAKTDEPNCELPTAPEPFDNQMLPANCASHPKKMMLCKIQEVILF